MKCNYPNKKNLLFTSSLFFSLVILFPQSHMAQQVEASNFKTFEDWCKNKDSLDEDVKHTVNVLLEKARILDCNLANKKLLNARFINLNGNKISNLLPLSSFINLNRLHLTDNKIVNIQPLEKLTKLTELGISGNRISDISPLKNLTNLTALSAKRNQITDVTPLKGLIELRYLFLKDNKITDISSLQSLKNISINSGIFTGNPIINKTCPFRKEVICSF